MVCQCRSLCDLFYKCILRHQLVKNRGVARRLYRLLKKTPESKREKIITRHFEKADPPKVSQDQINHYYYQMKKTGYDPDRHPVEQKFIPSSAQVDFNSPQVQQELAMVKHEIDEVMKGQQIDTSKLHTTFMSKDFEY